jgi:hypothetical protein
MKEISKTEIAVILVIACAIVAMVRVPWDDIIADARESGPAVHSKEYILNQQKGQIKNRTDHVGAGFQASIILKESEDDEGKPYYIGVLSKDLDDLLEELVRAYNADPKNVVKTDVDTIRSGLTDNISSLADNSVNKTALGSFILWCGNPADLVYEEAELYRGSIEYKAGDQVRNSGSNYYYISRIYPPERNFIYRHEYETGK